MSDGLKIPGSFEAMRTEGGVSVRNKKRAVSEEEKRRRKLSELTVSKDGKLETGLPTPPVLNVAPFPPYPAFSGSQIAMADRLSVEKDRRTVALAYPRDGAWWLEVWSAAASGFFPLGSKTNVPEIIAHAARLTRTRLVHVENIAGVPLNLVHNLELAGLRTILSVHDFIFFCRRPHLIEQPYGEFCDYSTEALRCRVCLRDIDPDGRTSQTDYRRFAAPSLHDASCLVFPSVFLQRQYELLFPRRQRTQREVVIAPATSRAEVGKIGGGRPVVAFIGGVWQHRGAGLISEVVTRVRESLPKAVAVIFGDGDAELFKQVRTVKKVRIQGYYPRGTLPEQLVREGVGVAVLPSIFPEAYALVVDETLSAGVPVVAFDHGAVGERLAFWQVGNLVPAALGAVGLGDAVVESLSRRQTVPDSVIRTLPQVDRVARRYGELYRGLRPQAR